MARANGPGEEAIGPLRSTPHGYINLIEDVFGINIVRVPYDIERAVRRAEAAQMPDLQPYINELRTARYRGAAQ